MTLSDGRVVNVAGEVALMSRNIVIEGAEYESIEEDMFGARILVTHYTNSGDEITHAGKPFGQL